MRIYCASKTTHIEFWKALRAAGVPLTACWLDWEGNENGAVPSPEAWSEHWDGCISGAASADIVLLFMQAGERHMGSLLEVGSALSAGKRVYAVLPSSEGLSFRFHPAVTVFASLPDAIEAIRALQDSANTLTAGATKPTPTYKPTIASTQLSSS
jgi:hypothetical protein